MTTERISLIARYALLCVAAVGFGWTYVLAIFALFPAWMFFPVVALSMVVSIATVALLSSVPALLFLSRVHCEIESLVRRLLGGRADPETAASIGNEIDVVLAESGRTISVGKRRALVRALADQSISFDGRDRARMVPLVIAFSEEPGA